MISPGLYTWSADFWCSHCHPFSSVSQSNPTNCNINLNTSLFNLKTLKYQLTEKTGFTHAYAMQRALPY